MRIACVLVRRTHGKHSRPTAAILDSQSVQSDGHGGRVGHDAGKRIKGRKRHLLVDILDLVLGGLPLGKTARGAGCSKVNRGREYRQTG